MEKFELDLIVLTIALAAISLILAGTIITKVPPMPSSAKARRAMLRLIDDAGVVPSTIYDLGSGWGGLAANLARGFPTARVTGVELSPLPWVMSWLWQVIMGPRNLNFRFGNALKVDLTDADLVVCFLCPVVMHVLDDKLARGHS